MCQCVRFFIISCSNVSFKPNFTDRGKEENILNNNSKQILFDAITISIFTGCGKEAFRMYIAAIIEC